MYKIEGVIVNNFFISSKEDFVNFYTQYFTENQKNINSIVDRLVKYLTTVQKGHKNLRSEQGSKEVKTFKRLWAEFENTVMLQRNKTEVQVTMFNNEEQAVKVSRIISLKQAMDESHLIQAKQVFEKQLGSTRAQNTATLFMETHMNEMFQFFEKEEWYRRFWGKSNNKPTPQERGYLYEIYFTHMARVEEDILDFLRGKRRINNDTMERMVETYSHHTVVSSEGDKLFTDFVHARKNNSAWYTGGDLVTIEEDGQLHFNIQLKTALAENATFELSIRKLRKQLIKIKKEKDPQQRAQDLWNFMKTEAYSPVERGCNKTLNEIYADLQNAVTRLGKKT